MQKGLCENWLDNDDDDEDDDDDDDDDVNGNRHPKWFLAERKSHPNPICPVDPSSATDLTDESLSIWVTMEHLRFCFKSSAALCALRSAPGRLWVGEKNIGLETGGKNGKKTYQILIKSNKRCLGQRWNSDRKLWGINWCAKNVEVPQLPWTISTHRRLIEVNGDFFSSWSPWIKAGELIQLAGCSHRPALVTSSVSAAKKTLHFQPSSQSFSKYNSWSEAAVNPKKSGWVSVTMAECRSRGIHCGLAVLCAAEICVATGCWCFHDPPLLDVQFGHLVYKIYNS